jgi:hypothetical protein
VTGDASAGVAQGRRREIIRQDHDIRAQNEHNAARKRDLGTLDVSRMPRSEWVRRQGLEPRTR